MSPNRALRFTLVALASLLPALVGADGPYRKIGEMELSLLGVSATVDPLNPVVPKNVASGVRIVVRAGGVDLTAQDVRRFLGGDFVVRAVLTGPGLPTSLVLPQTGPDAPPPSPDPLLLLFPGLPVAGNYDLSSVRIESTTGTVLDVVPPRVTVKIIDQILVTSVQTRALTLDEIRERGIVLDSDDYLGFEFTLGLLLESRPVNFTFPVVFDREGVPVPQPILPPPAPTRDVVAALPTIVPMLLDGEIPGEDGGPPQKITLRLPNGDPVRIPSVLVIPGNVGYLKQFFSAQLFVANGAPVGSGLSVRDVWGTIKLPLGEDHEPGTSDDPLTLPELTGGTAPDHLQIRGLGPDGQPGTGDDVAAFNPAEQGQAEFLLRGELEGFHKLDFDIAAVLDGLPVGPVTLKGKASGGVLVRNPYLDVTFTLPSVVRTGERFKLYATVSNIGQGMANDVYMSFEDMPLSGVRLESDPTVRIATIPPRDAKTLAFEFTSLRTGQVVASYLKFNAQPGTNGSIAGRLRFTMGIGERGIPLSPDTLVLPAAVDVLPQTVVDAAMRVLGQAWSIANAPPGTLPVGVVRTSKTVVTEKALTLAEAGLRMTLGQPEAAALRDLVFDFYGGESIDRGFDQLLRQTDAGHSFALALGAELHDPMGSAGGMVSYENDVVEVAASGPDFVTIAVGRGASAAPVDISLVDGSGRRTVASRSDTEIPLSNVPGAVFLPMGPVATAPFLGLIGAPAASPYTLELLGRETGAVDLSVTLPRGDGTFIRAVLTGVNVQAGSKARVVVDFSQPDALVYEEDLDGDGAYENQRSLTRHSVQSRGPQLVSANIIGPETLNGATPFGFQMALLFDRVVDPATAADTANYEIPSNSVRSARRQLSGRLVFALLDQPEGRLVPTDVTVLHMEDTRGAGRDNSRASIGSRVEDPGAVVTGQILNADGTAVGSGTVTYVNQTSLSCAYAVHSGLAAIPIGANGSYQFRYVRQDHCGWPFKIVTRDPSTSGAREAVRYVRFDGEQIVLDLVMMGRGAVAGTVRSLTGAAVVGAKVLAVSVTDPQIGGSAVTDELGRYLIPDITVGPVTVKAAKGISAGYASGRIERAGTTSIVDVTLDGGTVRASGTVRKLEQGVLSIVAGAPVVYNLMEGVVSARPVGVTQTDANGRYAFTGMPAGPYRIDARLNQRDQAQIAGTAASGDNLVNKDLVVVIPDEGPVATVHGLVAMPDGSAAADVIVSLEQRAVLTNALGEFMLPGVTVRTNQSRTVSARTRDGRRWGTSSVLVNEPDVTVEAGTIQLSGLGTVEFVVQDPAGSAVPNATVRIFTTNCPDPCGCSPKTTDANGRVRYENQALGTAWIAAIGGSAQGVDFARGSASLTHDGDTALGILRFDGFGAVGGTVLNPDGQPSHGADVSLTSLVYYNDGMNTCGLVPQVSHSARTGQDGLFQFANVHVGRVNLRASQPFFDTPVGAQGNLAQAGQRLDFTLRLVDTISGELSGTVYLPDGVTPAGAGVRVTATGALPDVVVQSNEQGRFRFAKIFPAGMYTLTALDPLTGNVSRLNVYLPAAQNVTQDLRLKGRGTVRVTVVDGADQPISQAQLRLRETEYPNGTYDGLLQASNGGTYTFGGVFEGPFTVEASDAFGRGGRVSGVLPRAGDTVEVKVRVTITGRVHGRFTMPDGATPIPYGTVRLVAGGRVIGQVTTTGTGAEVGSYAFDYVPAGPIRIEAQDPATARSGFSVGTIDSEDEDLALDVRAQGLGRVQGLVTSNGAPQPGAGVALNAGSFVASTIADSVGQYLFDGVPEGRVVVTASLGNSFLLGTASGVLVGDSVPNPQPLVLDVALRGSGEVTGQVFEADGLTPEPAAVVSISVGGTGGGTLSTVVDPEGHFRFERVPAGSARLSVDALGSIDQAVATADVPEAGTVDVPMVLNGVGAIEGELKDSGGNATPGRVTVQGSGAFPYSVGFEVGQAGTFRMPEVLAGPFSVSATIPGAVALYGSASGTVLPGQTAQVVIQAQPSGTVTAQVVRSDGTTPAFGAEASVVTQSGSVARTQVQPDGSFVVRGIPLGPFTVRVRDPLTGELATVLGQSVIANGQTVDIGTIVLDGQGPSITFVRPAPGSSQAALAGRLILEFSDVGSGFDPATLALYYNNSNYPTLTSFTWENNRASADLSPSVLVVGVNRITVAIRDRAGNETRTPLTFTITGATVRGVVSNADGTPVANATVVVGTAPAVQTNGSGQYVRTGLRPGQHWLIATDPATGLSASGWVTVGDGAEAQADLSLPAFASLTGVVKHPDGSVAPGMVVTVNQRSVTSDPTGAFDLGLLPLGTYTLLASDPGSVDRGRTDVVLSGPGQPVSVNLILNGYGSAEVTVRSAVGQLVPFAGVTLISSSPFASPLPGTANAQGVASFQDVMAGILTARATDPVTGLRGEASGLLQDRQIASLTVNLEAAGRMSGVVRHHDDSPASGVNVVLSGPRNASTSSDASGAFAFENLPLGVFTLSATDPSNNDRGAASGNLTQPGATVQADITLTGVGEVRVLVQDSFNNPIDDAYVIVTSSSPFAGARGQRTGADGRTAFTNVLAGTINAHTDVAGLHGESSGTLAAAGSLDLTLSLQAVGTVRGRVLEPNAVDPVTGAEVRLDWASIANTGEDGGFRFAGVRLGAHTLEARVAGRLRAHVTDVTLSSNGEEVVRDLVLVGVGTVAGLVTNSAGAPVSDASVQVYSQAPTYGGYWNGTTAGDGRFSIADVPLGAFTISATRGGDRADSSGTVTAHGELVAKNLQLLSSAVTLPLNLTDGNALMWTVNADGRLVHGYMLNGAPALKLARNGVTETFAGSGNLVGSEENTREIVVQQNLAGLSVTRKVFIPADGYFVRYLESVRNDGSEPATVDLLLESALQADAGVVTSSSGDPTADLGDRWLLLDDPNIIDIYDSPSPHWEFAPLGLALFGQGGLAPSSTSFSSAVLRERWDGVVVPAGGTVAFLHLMSGQADRTRGAAAAARLAQLPPEVLAGLSPQEAASVLNFQVPVDLVSSVAPLLNDGVVLGRVLASDVTTPAPNGTSVRFRSRSLYYGRPLGGYASPNGSYAFRGAGATVVPREPFDLWASVSRFGTQTTTASGDFPSTGVVDLTTMVGRVLRASTVYSNTCCGIERAVDGDLGTEWLAADGDAANRGRTPYYEIVLSSDATVHRIKLRGRRDSPGATPILRARLEVRGAAGESLWSQEVQMPQAPHDADVDLVPPVAGARSVKMVSLEDNPNYPALAEFVIEGETGGTPTGRRELDLVFSDTAVIQGRVLRTGGSPVVNATVKTSPGQSPDWVHTAADGSYRIILVPAGNYTVTAEHPAGSLAVSSNVDVTAGQTLDLDFVYPALGAVQGTLRNALAQGTAGAVSLTAPGFARSVATTSNGAYAFADVPPGEYSLTATHNLSQAVRIHTVIVVADATTNQDVAFPAVGKANVTATLNGVPFANGQVSIQADARGSQWTYVGATNAQGQFTAQNIPGLGFRVRVQHPWADGPYGETAGQITTEGEVVPVSVVVPVVGTVQGTARSVDGVPYTGVSVTATDMRGVKRTGSVDVSGNFSLTQLQAGPIRLGTYRAEVVSGAWAYSWAGTSGDFAPGATSLTLDALLARNTLSTAGQRDFWQLDLTQGSAADVLLYGAANGSAAALSDPYLEIYGPDGTLVASADNISAQNKNARVQFTAPTTGAYAMVARAAQAETGGLGLGSYRYDDIHTFRRYAGTWVEGRVLREGDDPLAGHSVRLYRGATLVWSMTTNGTGSYAGPLPGLGAFQLQVVNPEGIVVAEAAGDATAVGAITTDLNVPAHEQVTVTVHRGVMAVAGVQVTFLSDHATAFPGDRERVRVSDALGRATTPLPVGNVTVRATDPMTNTPYEASGVLAVGAPLNLDLSFATPPADIHGRVLARGGVTPLPGASVTLAGVGSTTTDIVGVYRFPDAPRGNHTLTATSPGPYGASLTLSLVAAAPDVVLDFTLDVVVLKGQVTESDGAPAGAALVQACGYMYSPYRQLCVTTTTDAAGAYAFFGLPRWYVYSNYAYWGQVYVTASWADTPGLTSSGSFYFSADVTATQIVDLELPVTGSLSGVVLDGGAPVSGATVIASSGGWTAPTVTTDSDGQFSLGRVPAGEARVYAAEPVDRIPGVARATIVARQANSVTVNLLPTATLSGIRLDEAGAASAGQVTLVAPAQAWTAWVEAQADGTFVRRVPAGPWRATVGQENCPYGTVGAAEGSVATSEMDFAEVRLGTHVCRDFSSGWEQTEFVSSAVPTAAEAYPSVASPQPGGQAFRSLRVFDGDVEVRTEQFTPTSGLFRRTLTFLTNTGTELATVEVESRLEFADGVRIIGETSNGDATWDPTDTFLVAVDDSGGYNEVAVVLGDLLEATSTWFEGGGCGDGCFPGSLIARHQVLVPPGETRSFLAFTLQGAAGDGTAATRARALAALTLPEALEGLAEAERNSIVNFTPVGQLSVSGRVELEGSPVAAARVGALDALGALMAETTADGDGRFTLAGLRDGDYTVVGVEPGTERPGRRSVTLAGTSLDLGALDLLPDAQLATVTLQVAGPGSYEGTAVEFVAEGWSPVWRPLRTLDANHLLTQAHVPPGPIVAATPLGAATGQATAGGHLTLTLTVGGGWNQVSGYVREEDGRAVLGVRVFAVDDSQTPPAVEAETATNARGRFVFTGLTLSDYRLVAVDPPTNRPAVTWVSPPNYRPSAIPVSRNALDAGVITLPAAYGTVQIQGLVEGSGAPAEGAAILLPTAHWALPVWPGLVVLDASGQAEIRGVAAGYVTAESGVPPNYGWEDGTLDAEATLQLVMRIGQRARVPVNLTGDDGMSYVADGYGAVSPSQNAAGPLQGAFAYRGDARLLRDGREVMIGPRRQLPGVDVYRRVFVPQSGRFARVLDVVSNPTLAALSVPYGLYQNLSPVGSQSTPWELAATSNGDVEFTASDTYAVLTNAEADRPALAYVLRGAGAVPQPYDGFTWYAPLTAPYRYWYSEWSALLVPPQSTVMVLQFVVQRPPGDTAAAETQAQALADLSDLEALTGLTPEEKAAIVNFVVPPGLLGGLPQVGLEEKPRLQPRGDTDRRARPRQEVGR